VPAPPHVELSDPRALRAVAHPTRLELIGLLRAAGPLTATQAGERLGESAASCSFHLRQLAKYGLVEEAGGGRGRERPWRATALFTRLPSIARTPEQAAASELLSSVIADRYFERLRDWLGRRAGEPVDWQQAGSFGDRILFVTADELSELSRTVDALLDAFVERVSSAEQRPEGSRQVMFVRLAFPLRDD
jgi:predicted ArsR family transcriptional regulator